MLQINLIKIKWYNFSEKSKHFTVRFSQFGTKRALMKYHSDEKVVLSRLKWVKNFSKYVTLNFNYLISCRNDGDGTR